jgi:hypothetical protein
MSEGSPRGFCPWYRPWQVESNGVTKSK